MVVGLTGGIATGKSTFSYLFKEFGASVVCCDELAHRALWKNTKTYRSIVEAFGTDILDSAKRIDRRKLATHVFRDKKKRVKLEEIVHPSVFARLFQYMEKNTGIIILDVPLLFETGFERYVDQTIVVWCRRDEQVRRLCARDTITKAAAEARIRAQMPLAKKRKKADHVIDNTDLATAVKTAKRVWKKLQGKSKDREQKQMEAT